MPTRRLIPLIVLSWFIFVGGLSYYFYSKNRIVQVDAVKLTPTRSTPVIEPVAATPSTDANWVKFKTLADEAFHSLPRIEQLRALPAREAHHTPTLLLEAGEKLGRVAAALKENPALRGEALVYYRHCAQDEHGANSVRALCYAALREIARQLDREGEFPPQDFPEHIREAADQIPE